MTHTLRVVACALALAFAGMPTWSRSAPDEVGNYLPTLVLSGQSTLRVWGLDIYTARLWVAPGFQPEQFARHGLALELTYLRAFSANDITRHSMAELRRQAGVPTAALPSWESALQGVIPDVRRGDRLIGILRPGDGAVFLANGRLAGVVQDAAFAARFFGIWLGPETSEPALRAALLGQVTGR